MNGKITKQVMEQYEAVRASGETNMFDIMNVAVVAHRKGFVDLMRIALDREDYMDLLKNFSFYMKKYDISQERLGDEEEN